VISRGVSITAFVTLVGFSLASFIGLLLAVAVLSPSKILRQSARFYIEVVRGIPMLVLLFYIAFVGAPAIVGLWNSVAEPLGLTSLRTRDFPLLWRAIIALTIGYSAFIAEVFRAGIQSIDSGQTEAAKALGLSAWHRFRYIVFPQAAGSFRFFETYNIVAYVYLLLTIVLSLMLRRLEARLAKRDRH